MRATTTSPRIILTAAAAAIALAVGVVPAQAAPEPAAGAARTVVVLGDEEVDPQFRLPDLCSLVPWVC